MVTKCGISTMAKYGSLATLSAGANLLRHPPLKAVDQKFKTLTTMAEKQHRRRIFLLRTTPATRWSGRI
jgi:hypothetical protein